MTFLAFGAVYALGYLWPLLIVLRNLSPLLTSLTFMLQPMLAQLFSTMFGLEPFPGMMTVFGGCIVLGGLIMVANAGSTMKTRKNSEGGPIDSVAILLPKRSGQELQMMK